ncbi:30S ribosomal protein S3 [Candidatus Aciduliprofundum boonei]|uniref:Small ribosomal subunit protein uS3 n=1 Tax=Aciduliprofundum boonei (strain DSM 19572 / T469) TaxID=439481 RepID=D3TB42_ACIB4|nr:30S ribosomal protein S3 [Candidatus Aciduliprofundum boonei]ADD09321.1 ribosomal protein S3 [Aciduliprofundum boonei T469]HII55210.1 30S ribosomal protein S3 [Candidatus Aciduliprofundum boonei]
MDERKFVKENVNRLLMKEYLMKETAMAGFGGLEIQRTPLGTRIILEVERPGMVIGRKGAKIKELTDKLQQDFGVENPTIEVKESPNPYLNAQIMAQKLAMALERGWHFRRAGHSTLRRIMEAGAKGAQIIISGKLTGDRARTEKFMDGTIKYNGKPVELVRMGYATAKTKPGIIGVTVKIMPPDAKLPDEVNILPPVEAEEEKVNEDIKEEVNENAEGTQSEADKGNESGREAKETQ